MFGYPFHSPLIAVFSELFRRSFAFWKDVVKRDETCFSRCVTVTRGYSPHLAHETRTSSGWGETGNGSKRRKKGEKKKVLLLLAFPYHRRTAVFRNLVFFSLLPYPTHPDCVKRERKHRWQDSLLLVQWYNLVDLNLSVFFEFLNKHLSRVWCVIPAKSRSPRIMIVIMCQFGKAVLPEKVQDFIEIFHSTP